MKPYVHPSKRNETNEFNRRMFLTGCAGCMACAATPWLPKSAFSVPAGAIDSDKPQIRLVFTHIPPDTPTWPYMGYDYDGRKQELTAQLRKECPNIDFHPVTVKNEEETIQLLATDEGIDGYLIYLLGIWTPASRIISESGYPTLLVDDLYGGSGEFLTQYAAARRKGLKVAGVSSTRFADVVEALQCFECIKKLKYSRIIDVCDNETLWGNPGSIEEVFGTGIVQVKSDEFNQAYEQADGEVGKEWAGRWIRNARAVVEPTREEIEKSGKIYVAMLNLMHQYKAQAIAVDCLGLYYGGKLP
ncbi:MAG: hypothetical protein C4527_20415, partial [Candidatus Omnitrophota bacterium]